LATARLTLFGAKPMHDPATVEPRSAPLDRRQAEPALYTIALRPKAAGKTVCDGSHAGAR
jgi:hypothetical protein